MSINRLKISACSLFCLLLSCVSTARAEDAKIAAEAVASPAASPSEPPTAASSPADTASPSGTAVAVSSPSESASKEGGIKIVALLHLTGDFSAEGNAFREGIDVAADEYNLQTGPNHVKVNVSFEDTKYDLKETSTAAALVTSDERVHGVIISTFHEVKAIAPKLEISKLPTIILWDSSKEIEDLGEYIFGIGPWSSDSGRKAADFAFRTLKVQSAFLLSTNNEWSSSVTKAFFDRSQKNGVVVKGSTSVNPEDRDFLSIINRIRMAGADSVVYAPLSSNLQTFGKQVHSSLMDTPVIMSDAISTSLLAQSRGAFEGFYHTMMADPEGPASMNLKKLYQARYDREPANLMLTALGYDALRMMVLAAEKSGNSRESIKNGLYGIKDMDGASGRITMSEKGSAPKYVSVFQVTDSKFKLIEKADGDTVK